MGEAVGEALERLVQRALEGFFVFFAAAGSGVAGVAVHVHAGGRRDRGRGGRRERFVVCVQVVGWVGLGEGGLGGPRGVRAGRGGCCGGDGWGVEAGFLGEGLGESGYCGTGIGWWCWFGCRER